MTYTTQQRQAMSDLHINRALTLKLAGHDWIENGELCEFGYYQMFDENGKVKYLDVIDYCNNPNDIMPMAFERKIGLMFNWNVENKWSAVSTKDYDDTNPLRAIACLLLMMED